MVAQLLAYAVTFVILFINYFARIFIIFLYKYLGYHTFSLQGNAIKKGVFLTQFFNTAILLLLVNANLSDTDLLFKEYFNGQYRDFSWNWYNDISASILQTMFLNAFIPIFEFGFWGGIRIMKRFFDSGFTMKVNKTKKTSI